MRRNELIGLILLATSAACGPSNGGGPDSAVTPTGAWAEIGTGTVGFERLAEDGDMLLVAGPQGGHHFIVTARMHGLEPGNPEEPGSTYNPATRFSVWSESGEQLDIMPGAYHLGYEEAGDGVYELRGGHIIQVREEEVAALYGARVRVRVEITDPSGSKVSDERWVVAIEDTNGPGDGGPGFDAQPAAWVEVGTGDTNFQPLAEEGDIVRYSGPQGGNHFFLHARMMGLSPDSPNTRFAVFNEAGNKVNIGAAFNLSYDDVGGGVYAMPYGQVVQLNPVPSLGARVRVTVELTDSGGLEVSDERWVIVVAP